jgi:iron complex outermembrane recepter protein
MSTGIKQFLGNNYSAGTFCNYGQTVPCATTNVFSRFYDLHTINNSVFSEVTHVYDPETTLKFGYRRDYFHTLAGELRDFLGSTIFPTSNGSRDDIANSGFVRLEKEVFPGGMAFIALANGERPASNIQRASFAGFDLKKEKNTGSEYRFDGDPTDVARIGYLLF